ncbi:MAG: 4-hydroxy-tetrahydrodipicolinate synthase, partial [Candidatus Bathyarchaeia archaeon]
MFKGCYTALITPMKKNLEVDYEGLKQLIEFQIDEGVNGVLAVGTTGESPTLTWNEHIEVIKKSLEEVGGRCEFIAGTGSNSSKEAIEATKESYDFGVKSILLVDPYYNGPSSLEIRREYLEPIAAKFPEVNIIPYIIPGRTGTKLLPQDLAILHKKFKNVNAVKEATGDLENARVTRALCGENFSILSGDDDKTFVLMTDPEIKANGVISVTSNIAPSAVQEMVKSLNSGDLNKAEAIAKGLKPLFEAVTVVTQEETEYGQVSCKARNPLPYKTLMNILGMPSGPCRPPLGKMTKKAIVSLVNKAREVYEENPEFLASIEEFFDVDLSERLYKEK